MKLFFTNTLLKTCILLLLVVGSASFAQAQIAMTRSTFAGTYTPITGTVTLAAGDDAFVTGLPIGFTFAYLGTNYTTCGTSTNGWLGLGTVATFAATNGTLATTATPLAALAPWWEDMNSSSIQYSTTGTAGSQVFTMQWTSLSYFSASTRTINYQVKLYEGTNVIEFWYGTASGANSTASASESASIGIKNAVGGPGAYLDAISGSAFIANGTLNTAQWPTQNFRFTPGAPIAIAAGTYNVGAGQTYTTLTEAVADINHRGVSGAVTLNLTDATYTDRAAGGNETFPIVFGPVAGTSAANTITLQGNAADLRYGGSVNGSWANGSATGTMFGATAEPILGVGGCDFLTVNNLKLTALTGIVIGTSTGLSSRVDRGLGVQNNTVTNGAKSNMFSNLTISLDRVNTSSIAIDQGQTVTATAQTGCNDDNTYQNLTIKNSYAGISLGAGGTAFLDNNNKINTSSCATYNSIGDPATPNDIGNGTVLTYGIRATGQSNLTISNCKIQNITSTGTAAIDGITLPNSGATTTSLGTCNIFNNFISLLTATSASSAQVGGLRINTTANAASLIRVYNNFVSGLTSASTVTTSRRIIGIRAQDAGTGAGGVLSFDFNSVSMSPAGIACPNACFEIGTTTGATIKVRSNIFSNTTAAQTGAAKHYCWASTAAANIGANTISNYNDLYVTGTNGFVGAGGTTTDYATLPNWTAGITTPATPDANSISLNPSFVAANDLHVSALGLNGAGDPAVATNAPWVTNDINCEVRPQPSGNFDIGADEILVCAGTPTAGTVSGANTVCVGSGTTLTLTGATVAAGISFQWYSSATSGGPYSPSGLGTSPTQATGALSADMYYVVSVTCSVSGFVATTPEKSVLANPSPVASITAPLATYCAPGTGLSLTANATVTTGGGLTYAWGPAAGLSATTGAAVTASPSSSTTYIVTATDASNGCTGTANTVITVFAAVGATTTATPPTVCLGANSQLATTAAQNFTTPLVSAYAFATSAGETLDPMVGATNIIGTGNDDTPSAATALPFTFNYNGSNYTNYSVSPDGFFVFTNTAATSQFSNAVTSATNIPKLYPYWEDMATGTDGNVKALVTGTAPFRILKIQWFTTIPRNTTGAANSTMQAWLYESTNKVEFRYGTMGTPSLGSASAGLTGASTNFNSITYTSNTASNATANDANAIVPASGTMYTFTPGGAPVLSYAWSPATFLSATNIANPMANAVVASTTYTVLITGNGGCTATNNITITAGELLVSTPTATPATICAGKTTLLNAGVTGGGGPFTYAWDNGATATVNPTVAPTTNTVYNVTVTDNCGSTATGSIAITVNPVPMVTITPSVAVICGSGSSVLTASGAATYVWAANATLSATNIAAPTATPLATTTYTVTATGSNSCTASTTVSIIYDVPMSITAAATPAAICVGASTTLSSTPASPVPSTYDFEHVLGAYVAITGGTVSTATGDDGTQTAIPIGFSFNYNGTAYTTFGVSTNGHIQMGSAAFPGSSWTNGLATKPNSIAAFWDDNHIGTGSISYLMSGVAPDRIMTVEWTNVAIGGGGTAAFSTNNYQIQLFEGSNIINFNYGTLDASNGTTASIGLSGSAGNFLSVTPSAVATASSSAENANITSVVDLPTGTSFIFTPPARTYAWTSTPVGFTDVTEDPGIASPSLTTTYRVVMTNALGCTAFSTVAVTVNSTAVTTTSITNTCPVTTVNLNSGITSSTAGMTFNFYTAADLATEITGTGITAAATGATYYVKATNTSTTCTATAAIVVTTTVCCINPVITSTSTNVLCFGGTTGSIALTQTGGDAITTYAWTGSASTTATASGLIAATTYAVTATAAVGCTTVLSGLVVAEPAAALTLTAASTANTACTTPNGTATFTAAGGTGAYTYVTMAAPAFMVDHVGVTAAHPNFGSTHPTVYTIDGIEGKELTLVRGVTYTFDATMVGGSHPFYITEDANGGGAGTQYTTPVSGSMVMFTPTVAMPNLLYYQCSNHSGMGWKINLVTPTSASMLTGLAAGSYTAVATDANGCMATATATVTDVPAPVMATLTKSSNLNCANALIGVTLTAGGGTMYDFGTGFTASNTFTAMTATTYTVIVKAANGCTGMATIAVTSNTTAPVANVMGNFAFCTGASTALIASPGFTTYAWSAGTAGTAPNKRNFTTAGTYSVTITATNGCTVVKSFTTVINSKPTLAGVSVPVVCAGSNLQGSVTVTSAIAATTTWTAANGFTASGTTFSRNPATTPMSGTYIIRSTNACGTTSAAATATVKATMPITVAINNASTLGGSTGSINVTAPAMSTFSWSGSAVTTGVRTNLPVGTYVVTVSPPLGSPYCPVVRSIVIN